MKDTVTVMVGVGFEMTFNGEMKGVIEDAKGREGSKSIGMLDEGGVEVLNEIGIGSFTGDELNFKSGLASKMESESSRICRSWDAQSLQRTMSVLSNLQGCLGRLRSGYVIKWTEKLHAL